MGGCSTVNHMVYIRGNPEDFNHWAEMGNIGWNYEEVLEYFKKSENNLDEDVRKQHISVYKINNAISFTIGILYM